MIRVNMNNITNKCEQYSIEFIKKKSQFFKIHTIELNVKKKVKCGMKGIDFLISTNRKFVQL